jgi:hypothetical protein
MCAQKVLQLESQGNVMKLQEWQATPENIARGKI